MQFRVDGIPIDTFANLRIRDALDGTSGMPIAEFLFFIGFLPASTVYVHQQSPACRLSNVTSRSVSLTPGTSTLMTQRSGNRQPTFRRNRRQSPSRASFEITTKGNERIPRHQRCVPMHGSAPILFFTTRKEASPDDFDHS